ncbi:hypothetical protein COU77_01445 [Candidatus Peregrinibacteria bacterium CG10_big_fil_rev_8_21_14_0_10_49_16]|nr:MAG: hypothetical protein COW95_01195 [Candidatus Peregrinibacteria bacterium CG22_combo_CG10-13_8_21_14_all_49_11]PIR52238.1 MAG: hypothetical protein COU77_01445 [Candidatus Peregrinibacteria bacterium CG10_big_fil_rev_8_21_14_0_10_49_16]
MLRTFSADVQRVGRWVLCLLCGLAALFLLHDFVRIFLLSFQALEWDALIFFTIGRGILNGLTPYIDLFESKPPGIYLFTVASLLLTGGDLLYRMFAVGCFVLLGCGALVAYIRALPSRRGRPFSIAGGCLALTLGMLVTLYLQERAPGGQAEFFGCVFGALFVYNMATAEDRWSWLRILCNSLFLAGAIGTKEPFLFTVLGAAILLAKSPGHFVKYFLVPLVVGGVLGVLVLAVFGLLGPYVEVYLPVMVGSRTTLNAEEHLPFWGRGLSIRWLYGNVTRFFLPAPLLGYLLGVLFSSAVVCWRGRRGTLVTCAALAGFVGLFYLMFVSEALLILSDVLHWQSPSILTQYHRFSVHGLILVFLFTPLLWFLWKQKLLFRFVLLFPVLYLLSFAVGSGGYLNNHFAFAFPVYFAITVLFVQSMAQGSVHPLFVVAVGTMTVWSAFWYEPSTQHLEYLSQMQSNVASVHRDRAEQFDTLLDACGVDRYVSDAGYWSGLGFTRHSPIGPMPTIGAGAHSYLPRDHWLFLRTAENVIRDGTILAMKQSVFDEHPLKEFFVAEFTSEVPSCAASYVPVGDLVVQFRKEAFHEK